jgi:AbrB family looped-hinge helix DNA binding protein
MTEQYFASAKMTGRGQITLPKKVQDTLNIKLGEYVVFLKEKDRLYIKKGRIRAE